VTTNTPSGVLPCRTTVFTGLPRAEMLVGIDAFAITAQFASRRDGATGIERAQPL
jgi:hypothetical protein